MNKQEILDYIMKDEVLARKVISNILNINNIRKIYYTEYKNLYNIDNCLYIYFYFGDDKNISGIYNAIKYYYEFLSKSKDKFEFFYISFNDFNISNNREIVIQVKDRNTKEILIDNFNVICSSFLYLKKEYDMFIKNIETWYLFLYFV